MNSARFNPMKDERLVRILAEAGLYGFFTWFCLAMLLMTLSKIVQHKLLEDADFVLMIPWFLSSSVFLIVAWKKGYSKTVREEATRTPAGTREARIKVIASTASFAVLMFLMDHFNIFDSETDTVMSDILNACALAVVWGAAMWFMDARRGRNRDEEQN